MADTSNSVLFDAPGPKGRRTIRIVNWIAGILFAVVLVLILMRLHNPPDGENQLSWELWKPAVEREAWTDFYLPGLWMTIKATIVAVVGAVVFGLVFGVGRLDVYKRQIQDRNLPDKAIDLIDEAGARLRIKRLTAPPELKELDEKIAKIAADKDEAIKGQDFEKAAELRDKQEKLEADRKQKEDSWREGESDVKMVVDEDVIAEVISSTTGIPVFKLTQAESKKLLNMEAELHKRIIGQDEAVSALSRSIRRTRVGLKDPKRPSCLLYTSRCV